MQRNITFSDRVTYHGIIEMLQISAGIIAKRLSCLFRSISNLQSWSDVRRFPIEVSFKLGFYLRHMNCCEQEKQEDRGREKIRRKEFVGFVYSYTQRSRSATSCFSTSEPRLPKNKQPRSAVISPIGCSICSSDV